MFKIAGGQVTGTSHLARGEEGQDRIACYRDVTGVCIALADGAGSRRMSQYAAEIMTRQISEYVVKNFKELYEIDDIEKTIYEKCMNIIKESGIPTKEMACTLLCYAIVDGSYISIHVGDGMIVYVNDTEKKVLSKPQNGQDLSETYFVQNGMSLSSIRVDKGIAENGTYFLMSDGTMTSLFSKRDIALTEAVRKLAGWLELYDESEVTQSVLRFLDEMCRCNTQDDMSIQIMRYEGEMEEDEEESVDIEVFEDSDSDEKTCLYYDEEDEFSDYTSRELVNPDEFYDVERHSHWERLYDLDEYYP